MPQDAPPPVNPRLVGRAYGGALDTTPVSHPTRDSLIGLALVWLSGLLLGVTWTLAFIGGATGFAFLGLFVALLALGLAGGWFLHA